jgi:hypothetical protein
MKKNYAENLANLRMTAICLAQLEQSVIQGNRFSCMDVSANALWLMTNNISWTYFDSQTYEPEDWLKVISVAEQNVVGQMIKLQSHLMKDHLDQLDMRVWLDTLAEVAYLVENSEPLLTSACYLILKHLLVVPVDVAAVFQSLLEETDASPELFSLFVTGVYGRYDITSDGCMVERILN